MAKQNVTFIERHVEKIVVGVAALTLVVVAFLYLVQPPHAVPVRGEPTGPDQLYDAMQERAEQVRAQMDRAETPPPDQSTPSLNLADRPGAINPYEEFNIPKQFAVAPMPLTPGIPKGGEGPGEEKVRLAEILPPHPVELATGHSYTRLSPPVFKEPLRPDPPEPPPAVTGNHHWVTILSAVHRKDQREVFDKAHYLYDRQNLIIAGVEAQRQQLLSNGEWSEPEIVAGYSPVVVRGPRQVALHRQDDGSLAVLDQDAALIQEYSSMLGEPAQQGQILRPPFQSELACVYEWEVPATLDGLDINLADYNVLLPEPEDGKPRVRPERTPRVVTPPRPRTSAGREGGGERGDVPRRATQYEGGAPPASPTRDRARTGRAEVLRLFKEAKEAEEKKDYRTAHEKLLAIRSVNDASDKDKADADEAILRIQPDIDRLAREEFLAAKREGAAQEQGFGEDVEPLWVNDIRVKPGKTYRYRLRILAFNQYVGLANRLEEPDDAGKVVIEGNWSDWSDPIQVKPAMQMFFTTVREATKTAQVVLARWDKGKWNYRSEDRSVGMPVVADAPQGAGGDGSVVVDIDYRRNWQQRSASSSGQVSYMDRESAAVVLVTADGDVEERFSVEENRRRSALVQEVKAADKRCENAPVMTPQHGGGGDRFQPGPGGGGGEGRFRE